MSCIGSRYVKGGGVVNWPLSRKLVSRGGSLYSRAILGLPYHDLTGGYKCFRRHVLETLDLDGIGASGYGFQIEMTYRAHQAGFKITESTDHLRRPAGGRQQDEQRDLSRGARSWSGGCDSGGRRSRPPARRLPPGHARLEPRDRGVEHGRPAPR